MHIIDFFQGLEARPASPEKIAALEQAFAPGPLPEAPFVDALLNTFPADDAFDHYFSALMAKPMAETRACNYPLACLINFGVHQLTMRRFDDAGNQMFLQIGTQDSHEFICGILRNAAITCHLVTEDPMAADTLASLRPFVAEKWNGKPQVFGQTAQAYFSAQKPNIGLLSLVNLDSREAYFNALSLAWMFLDDMADIIVQGSEDHLKGVTETFAQTKPDLRIQAKDFKYLDETGTERDQRILVFPKVNHDFASLIPEGI
ncbi:MAG: hypothetical protein ACPGOV_15955 [Magnetovibrionaceae bacterium]